jgi:hypothetical protein
MDQKNSPTPQINNFHFPGHWYERQVIKGKRFAISAGLFAPISLRAACN